MRTRPPDQVIARTANLYWRYQTGTARQAGTVETKDVKLGGPS